MKVHKNHLSFFPWHRKLAPVSKYQITNTGKSSLTFIPDVIPVKGKKRKITPEKLFQFLSTRNKKQLVKWLKKKASCKSLIAILNFIHQDFVDANIGKLSNQEEKDSAHKTLKQKATEDKTIFFVQSVKKLITKRFRRLLLKFSTSFLKAVKAW